MGPSEAPLPPWASVSPSVGDGPQTHPTPTAPRPAHLLWELGSPQQLQGLQVGVEEGAGLQAATQLALDNVAHGAVVRQTDERGGFHEAGATERQSRAVAAGLGPQHPELPLPPRRPSLHQGQWAEQSSALPSASCALCDLRQATNLGGLSLLFCEMGASMAPPSLGHRVD